MQHRARAMNAYRAAAETVSPAVAIVMLYDGAIQRLALAKCAIIDSRIEDRFNLVNKATAIIHGLQSQLDFGAGGEIAEMLNGYYNYILHRMNQINISNDSAICDEIIERLREMRASWALIAKGADSEAPSTAISLEKTPSQPQAMLVDS